MEIHTLTVGPFAENTYFVVDEASREAVAIDPGDEAPRLLEAIRRLALDLRHILNTHGHLDHVGAVAELREATGATFHIHRADQFLLDSLASQAVYFGLEPPPIPDVDAYLDEGQTFRLGGAAVEIRTIATPGHSPGGVTFQVGDSLFVGDALFRGSIGRTDLPGGDSEVLLASIREKILVFPDETRVHSGHGPVTTVGEERRTNPFLLGALD